MVNDKTNRIELIHMLANLIEERGYGCLEDRTGCNMLAIHIVDGLEAEAEKRTQREKAMTIPEETAEMSYRRGYRDGALVTLSRVGPGFWSDEEHEKVWEWALRGELWEWVSEADEDTPKFAAFPPEYSITPEEED